jgi:hypothetical protein
MFSRQQQQLGRKTTGESIEEGNRPNTCLYEEVDQRPVFGLFSQPNIWPSERPIFGLFPPPKEETIRHHHQSEELEQRPVIGLFPPPKKETLMDKLKKVKWNPQRFNEVGIDKQLRVELMSYKVYRGVFLLKMLSDSEEQPVNQVVKTNIKFALDPGATPLIEETEKPTDLKLTLDPGATPLKEETKRPVPSLREWAKFVILEEIVFNNLKEYTTSRFKTEEAAWVKRNEANEPMEIHTVSIFQSMLYNPLPPGYIVPSSGYKY